MDRPLHGDSSVLYGLTEEEVVDEVRHELMRLRKAGMGVTSEGLIDCPIISALFGANRVDVAGELVGVLKSQRYAEHTTQAAAMVLLAPHHGAERRYKAAADVLAVEPRTVERYSTRGMGHLARIVVDETALRFEKPNVINIHGTVENLTLYVKTRYDHEKLLPLVEVDGVETQMSTYEEDEVTAYQELALNLASDHHKIQIRWPTLRVPVVTYLQQISLPDFIASFHTYKRLAILRFDKQGG